MSKDQNGGAEGDEVAAIPQSLGVFLYQMALLDKMATVGHCSGDISVRTNPGSSPSFNDSWFV